MSKKISFNNIVKNTNDLLDVYSKKHGMSMGFHFSTLSSSTSEKIDPKAKIIIELYLPIILILMSMFYVKSEYNAILSEEEKMFLEDIKKEIDNNFKMNLEKPEKYEEYRKSFTKKYYLPKLSRNQITSINDIIFDDVSQEHKHAFKNKIPDKNILLKIKDSSRTHFRLGIKINIKSKETDFIFIDMVKKKTRNN